MLSSVQLLGLIITLCMCVGGGKTSGGWIELNFCLHWWGSHVPPWTWYNFFSAKIRKQLQKRLREIKNYNFMPFNTENNISVADLISIFCIFKIHLENFACRINLKIRWKSYSFKSKLMGMRWYFQKLSAAAFSSIKDFVFILHHFFL